MPQLEAPESCRSLGSPRHVDLTCKGEPLPSKRAGAELNAEETLNRRLHGPLKLVGLAFLMIDEERHLLRRDQLPDFFRLSGPSAHPCASVSVRADRGTIPGDSLHRRAYETRVLETLLTWPASLASRPRQCRHPNRPRFRRLPASSRR